MPRKKRSTEEVEAILRDHKNGIPLVEICGKYEISATAFHRLKTNSQGFSVEKKKADSKIRRLEKIIAQQELEIRLMKAALKKS